MEIDVVYTWVNHKDPKWQQMYRQAVAMRGNVRDEHQSVNDPARFTARNELFYSIHSVRKYAPWVRNIYIVSNCAQPEWSKSINNLVYVNHSEIFLNQNNLPTFNSRAIESNLHRIDGISENILYFNDDMFLCQYAHPSDFFWGPGQVYFFPSKHNIPYEKHPSKLRPVEDGMINAANLLVRDFGYKPAKKLHHSPYPLSKSLLEEIEDCYFQKIDRTRRHPFRHVEDIPMATTMHAYYAKCVGRGIEKTISSRYVDIGNPLFLLLVHPFSPLMRGKYMTLCLNEVTSLKYFQTLRDYIVKNVMVRLFSPSH